MTTSHIQYEEANQIAEITISRPEKRNAFTAEMFTDLRACFDRFSTGEARVAILKSCDDKVFSAGADLTNPPENFWQGVPEFGFRCDKPIIAAISGKAIGVGMVLAMMSDFVVVTQDAELIYPEAKIGIAKGAVTALMRRVPMRVALEMILIGDPIPAQHAYETGMVNRITPNGQHVAVAREMAEKLSANAPLVVEMLKRMSLDALGDTPIQTLFDASRRIDHVVNSQDAKDALDAFRAKRKPTFNGR